jgi:hypothetical protein
MKRWLVIAGVVAARSAQMEQMQSRAVRCDLANARAPAAAVGGATDVVAGATFADRDPDRHIRFRILRDTSRF